MKNFKDTKFYKMGSLFLFNDSPYLHDTFCTFDATLYSTNKPQCYKNDRNKFHVHLCLYLSVLQNEMPEMAKFIQHMWDTNNEYISKLGAKPYHQFLVINHINGVETHSHGDFIDGDTLIFVAVLGNTPSKDCFFVFNESNIKVKYPEPNSGYHFLSFEKNLIHHTECPPGDSNYYFHFVNDLTHTIDIQKNVMIPLNDLDKYRTRTS